MEAHAQPTLHSASSFYFRRGGCLPAAAVAITKVSDQLDKVRADAGSQLLNCLVLLDVCEHGE